MSSALSLEADGAVGRPELAALVYKTERSDKTVRIGCARAFVWNGYERRCDRWECPSCGPKKARETGLMLLLDAETSPPVAALTVTTADPLTTPAQFRKAMEAARRRMRRHFGYWEDYQRIEFSTGRAVTSGGFRRMHGHSAVKLPPGVDLRAAEALWRGSWSKSLPGNPWRVELAELRTQAGLIHYLSLHHAKAAQLPPREWRGMHDRATQGYFSRSVPELRREVRARVWAEGLAYRTGLAVEDARFLVDQQRAVWDELKSTRAAVRDLPAADERWAPIDVDRRLALFSDEDIPF